MYVPLVIKGYTVIMIAEYLHIWVYVPFIISGYTVADNDFIIQETVYIPFIINVYTVHDGHLAHLPLITYNYSIYYDTEC